MFKGLAIASSMFMLVAATGCGGHPARSKTLMTAELCSKLSGWTQHEIVDAKGVPIGKISSDRPKIEGGVCSFSIVTTAHMTVPVTAQGPATYEWQVYQAADGTCLMRENLSLTIEGGEIKGPATLSTPGALPLQGPC